MLMKKLTLAAAALAVSATAFADPPRWAPAHGYRGDHNAPHYVVRPAYRHYYYQPYYRPAPRVVVVQRAVPVYPPYPAYPAYHAGVDVNTGVGIVVGAVLGGVIAHELSR
ncbi:MAG TPA: hypothetical protein VN929_12445 [Burkholderiales bacterium]|nr:hypothetical protein [Burkholderiales bacterium]